MPDYTALIAACLAALNEAYALDGQPTVAAQQAAAVTAATASLTAKIDAARTAALADKAADNASVAGQGVLDALA